MMVKYGHKLIHLGLNWKSQSEESNKLHFDCDVINDVIMMSHTGNESSEAEFDMTGRDIDHMVAQ